MDHVWAYDFVACRTHSGKPIRLLTVIDEWSRECLAIKVTTRLRSDDVLATLTELMVRRGVPEYIRSDNGPEFTARRVRDRIERIGAKTLFIEPGSPWENGYNESFNGKLRDELLNIERGGGAYRGVERDVQPDPAAQFVGLSTSGTRCYACSRKTTSRCLA